MELSMAYTSNKKNIPSALALGQINEGDMVFVNQDNQYGELLIIDDDKQIIPIASTIKNFASIDSANIFLSNNKENVVIGDYISVGQNDGYMLYYFVKRGEDIVLEPFATSGYILPNATESTLGGVIVDGSTIRAVNGRISVEKLSHSLNIGNKKYDGSSDITITASDINAYTKDETNSLVQNVFQWNTL